MRTPKALQFIVNRLHQLDPTADALIGAIKCTLPGLVGLFVWIYFRNPFSFWIILLPIFAIFPAGLFPKYKGKFCSVGFFFFSLAVMQFAVAVLYIHPYLLVFVLFILTFIAVSSIKYRYAAVFAILCAVIYIELQQGWYNGVNRLIGICIAAFITVASIIIYENIFSIIKIRFTILFLMELMLDGFSVFTKSETEEIQIFNKYLFRRPLSIRADFNIEKMFRSNREKFIHRILMELINRGKFIESEEFIFKKNIKYRDYIYPAYILLKRIFRDITFILRYNIVESRINALLPTTSKLLENSEIVLRNTYLSFKNDKYYPTLLSDKIVNKWNDECESLKISDIEVEEEILDFIYGFRCMLSDVKELQSILLPRR